MAKKPHDDDDEAPAPAPAPGKGSASSAAAAATRGTVAPQVMTNTPGWSNTTDTTPIVWPPTPGVDMTIPGFSNNGPASTGATAGMPGAWTPAGSDPPNKFQSMDTITAAPATAWTTGQYMRLGDGSLAHWAGAAWASGKA